MAHFLSTVQFDCFGTNSHEMSKRNATMTFRCGSSSNYDHAISVMENELHVTRWTTPVLDDTEIKDEDGRKMITARNDSHRTSAAKNVNQFMTAENFLEHISTGTSFDSEDEDFEDEKTTVDCLETFYEAFQNLQEQHQIDPNTGQIPVLLRKDDPNSKTRLLSSRFRLSFSPH